MSVRAYGPGCRPRRFVYRVRWDCGQWVLTLNDMAIYWSVDKASLVSHTRHCIRQKRDWGVHVELIVHRRNGLPHWKRVYEATA